jgi:hypothetical protein
MRLAKSGAPAAVEAINNVKILPVDRTENLQAKYIM